MGSVSVHQKCRFNLSVLSWQLCYVKQWSLRLCNTATKLKWPVDSILAWLLTSHWSWCSVTQYLHVAQNHLNSERKKIRECTLQFCIWKGKILEQDLSISVSMLYKHHVFIRSIVTLQQQMLWSNNVVPHNAERIIVQPWVWQQHMKVNDKWQRRDDCRLGTGCVRFCDDIENGWGKGQKVNKKGMSKILNFKVYLSVLALAARLSLKHLTTKCTHFLLLGYTHQSKWIRYTKTRGDKFLQLHLVHVPPPQGLAKTI